MAFSQPKASSTARGYGAQHEQARRAALDAYRPSQPCHHCGRPLGTDTSRLHLDHAADRRGYRGLAHASCNRRDGARRGARRANARRHRVSRGAATVTTLTW